MSAQFLEHIFSSIWFLPTIFFLGLIAGTYSCSLLEVPFLSALVSSHAKNKKDAAIKSSLFILGLITSYILIGLFFSQLANWFSKYTYLTQLLFLILGAISIFWGIRIIFADNQHCSCSCGCAHDSHHHHTHTPSHTKKTVWDRVKNFGSGKRWYHLFIIGNLFAWLETPICPCCGPVIYVLSALTVLKGKILFGIATFFVYALGQGIPVLLFTVFLTHITTHPKFIKSKHLFFLLEGNLLLFLGLLFLWIA